MTKRSNTGKGTFGDDLQCVAPDHDNRLGTTNGAGASLVVPNGSSIESDAAPKDGHVIITIPAIVVRVRVDTTALADADDFAYIGAYTFPMPIAEGQRVSLYGDGGTGTATVVMAK